MRFLAWNRRSVYKLTLPTAPGSSDATAYTCPACGVQLYERCPACQAIRHSLLPFCENCAAEKPVAPAASVAGANA